MARPESMLAAILAAVLAVSATGVASAAIPASERDALIALYKSTDGPNWYIKTGWLGPPGTGCSWFEVVCGPGQETVVEIDLYWNDNGNTVVSVPSAVVSATTGYMFADGFESGDTQMWTSTEP
jgi:hypothetical protein